MVQSIKMFRKFVQPEREKKIKERKEKKKMTNSSEEIMGDNSFFYKKW